MDMTSHLPASYPPAFSPNGGFGCRSEFMSPIYCQQDTSHLSDSGIYVSGSKIDTSLASDDVPLTPPGFPPSPYKNEYHDERRPLGCLAGNAQYAGVPQYSTMRYPQNYRAQSPSAPYLLSPLTQLRLDDGAENENSYVDSRNRSLLPSWVMDGQGRIIAPLRKLLEDDLLETFAKDKNGCTFLQANYPDEGTYEREILMKQFYEKENLFTSLCTDVFGNFFIQCVVQNATVKEQHWITSQLHNKLYPMCLNRYSCRVVQKIFECLPEEMKSVLVLELHSKDLVKLCTDQNANHVVQKIMTSFPLAHWKFIVDQLIFNEEKLFSVAENKYGCRVVQLAIELLSDTNKKTNKRRAPMLEDLMKILVANCERLASNEFANYVIQHVIKAGPLSDYRDHLIEECLLRNLLSLSQEKYASHVVEKALEFAPPSLLAEMMDEIFDGYVPHPETKKDALDIMLFHQYGNYVVQRMLDICCEAARAQRNGINLPDMRLRLEWLKRLEARIAQNRNRLSRYSSGKKILGTLQQLNAFAAPVTPTRNRRSSTQSTCVPSKYR